jgi:hypothetical protein
MIAAVSRGQQRDKPFQDALRMEIAAAGEDLKALRKVAKALLAKVRITDAGRRVVANGEPRRDKRSGPTGLDRSTANP